VQEFGGVRFDIRGIVQLSGQSAAAQLSVKFPKEIKGINVDQSARKIQFLHAAAWTATEGATIGRYVVHYENGEQREIPIVYGRDVRDWWTQSGETASTKLEVVWTGKNTTSQDGNPPVRLFRTTWPNPLPDAKIQSLDYVSTMSSSAPFLIAVTLE
jgi:hypothetical protein